MHITLKNKTTFVTGVSSGIGREIASLLAERGARVFGTARNAQTASPIPGVEIAQMDVTDDASVNQAVQTIVRKAGPVGLLVNKHFVELATKELQCVKPRLTTAAISQLQSYDWPGNVRELRNVIERAVILARGVALYFELPISAQVAAPPVRPQPLEEAGTTQPRFLTEVEVQRFERENLVLALQAANWKVTGRDSAAELLGLKPTTLLSRMVKWGLKKPEAEPA